MCNPSIAVAPKPLYSDSGYNLSCRHTPYKKTGSSLINETSGGTNMVCFAGHAKKLFFTNMNSQRQLILPTAGLPGNKGHEAGFLNGQDLPTALVWCWKCTARANMSATLTVTSTKAPTYKSLWFEYCLCFYFQISWTISQPKPAAVLSPATPNSLKIKNYRSKRGGPFSFHIGSQVWKHCSWDCTLIIFFTSGNVLRINCSPWFSSWLRCFSITKHCLHFDTEYLLFFLIYPCAMLINYDFQIPCKGLWLLFRRAQQISHLKSKGLSVLWHVSLSCIYALQLRWASLVFSKLVLSCADRNLCLSPIWTNSPLNFHFQTAFSLHFL